MHCSITADIEERLPFHEHPPHELIVCGSDTGVLEINGKLNDYRVGEHFSFLLVSVTESLVALKMLLVHNLFVLMMVLHPH